MKSFFAEIFETDKFLLATFAVDKEKNGMLISIYNVIMPDLAVFWWFGDRFAILFVFWKGGCFSSGENGVFSGISYSESILRLTRDVFRDSVNVAKAKAFLKVLCCEKIMFWFCCAHSFFWGESWDSVTGFQKDGSEVRGSRGD